MRKVIVITIYFLQMKKLVPMSLGNVFIIIIIISTFLVHGITRLPRVILCLLQLSLESRHFSRSPGSFQRAIVFRNQDQGIIVVIAHISIISKEVEDLFICLLTFHDSTYTNFCLSILHIFLLICRYFKNTFQLLFLFLLSMLQYLS